MNKHLIKADLLFINGPEDFEEIVKSIPNVSIFSQLRNGQIVSFVDAKGIILVKKEIFNSINLWRQDFSKYPTAYNLMKDLTDEVVYNVEQEENYLRNMVDTLDSIERHTPVRPKGPTERQQKAINNLKNAISQYKKNKEVDIVVLKSLYDRRYPIYDITTFNQRFFGTDFYTEGH